MNIEKFVRPNILAMTPYTSLRDHAEFSKPVLLDANENPYGIYNRYPDSTQKRLKEKLSEIKNIPADCIALGNGSDELIDLLIKIFCIPGKDAVAVINPSFAMYSFYAEVHGSPVIKLQLDEDFQLAKEEFLSKTQHTNAKILFLCSPNNPTGNSLENIEFFIENFDGIVVVDEAYTEFSPNISAIDYLNRYNNLVILQTLSKAWGLAGLRIGMAIASPFIISLISKVKSPYNISSVNIQMALMQLNSYDDYRFKLNEILTEKSRMQKKLSELETVVKIYPSQANFFLVEFAEAGKTYEKLLEKNILTSKRFPSIPGCLRINIGTSEENDFLIETLKNLTTEI